MSKYLLNVVLYVVGELNIDRYIYSAGTHSQPLLSIFVLYSLMDILYWNRVSLLKSGSYDLCVLNGNEYLDQLILVYNDYHYSID